MKLGRLFITAVLSVALVCSSFHEAAAFFDFRNKTKDFASSIAKRKDNLFSSLLEKQFLKFAEKSSENEANFDREFIEKKFPNGQSYQSPQEIAGICKTPVRSGDKQSEEFMLLFCEQAISYENPAGREAYNEMTEHFAGTIPGIDKASLQLALSVDFIGVLLSALATAKFAYWLTSEQMNILYGFLGSMGIGTIMYGNPLLGVALIASTAYMVSKIENVDGWKAFKVASGMSIGTIVMSSLPFSFTVEFIISLVAIDLFHRNVNKHNYEVLELYIKNFSHRAALLSYGEMSGVLLSALSQKQLVKWAQGITESTATKFDKALDADYLKTGIGGGSHRLFDGGHTLKGAWTKISTMCAAEVCATREKFEGYMNALWKDMNTSKGLPFVNLEKETYDRMADWMTQTIPGVDKNWVCDAFSFDALEVLSAALSVVGVVYLLGQKEMDKVAQLLGSMGIISIISANPILGVMTVASVAYMVKTGKPVDGWSVVKGASGASIATLVFSLMSAPFIVELVVALTAVALFNKHANRENIGNLLGYSADSISRQKELLANYMADLFSRQNYANGQKEGVFRRYWRKIVPSGTPLPNPQ
ncbi:MAG: hypothetical protein ACR2NQ_02535 [Thermodesulfobacteriota bacterium]